MSKLARLAQLLTIKYGLQSEATVDEARLIASAKQDVMDAFTHHFSDAAQGAISKGPKGSIFRLMAGAGDPLCERLVYRMDNLVAKLDELTPSKMLGILNDIMIQLSFMNSDEDRIVRNNIRQAFRGHSEAAVKGQLARYSDSLKRTHSLLKKAATKLQILRPQVEVPDQTVVPPPGELTLAEMTAFVQRTPAFKSFGLDSIDVVSIMNDDPALKRVMTKVVNAVNRGLIPRDGPEVQKAAQEIKAWIDNIQAKKQTVPI
jgi:uncharacterized coiled-coil protein SlyX